MWYAIATRSLPEIDVKRTNVIFEYELITDMIFALRTSQTGLNLNIMWILMRLVMFWLVVEVYYISLGVIIGFDIICKS